MNEKRGENQAHMDVNKFIGLVFESNSAFVLKNRLEQVRLLVQEFPDLLEPNSDGYLPLHSVCQQTPGYNNPDHNRHHQVQKIQRLMEIHSSCLIVQSRGNVPLLYLLSNYATYMLPGANIDPKFLDLAKKMIQAEPIAVMMRKGLTVLPNPFHLAEWTTALHIACQNDDMLPIVDMILSIDPESIHELDSRGELPLHIACSYQQVKITKRLLCVHESNKIPHSVPMTLDGNTPLHSALWHFKVDPQLIRLLVNKYPSSLSMKTRHKETPLHFACFRGASIEVIEMLVRADHNVLGIQDSHGNIPFHSIFAFYPLHDLIPIMRHIAPLFPELTKIRDKHGNLPGHRKGIEKFLTDVTPIVEIEYALHKYLEWVNETSRALCSCRDNQAASIVLDWATTQKADCLQQLSSMSSKLHDLITTYEN